MNKLFDVLLAKPLPDAWLQGFLFSTFTLHLLFVLITLGTAMLAVALFAGYHWGGKPMELDLDRRILRTFLAHKSLAVVLGVAPLLLIQVTFATSFFTAVNFLAPYWLSIIALLIVAFLTFDILGHGIETHRRYHLAVALVALTCLLLVPGIFAALLTTMENSGQWLAMARHGFRLRGDLAGHWLWRYLHVLGASLVFGAAYHYFFTARLAAAGKATLLRGLVAGLVLQFPLGFLLYNSLMEKLDPVTLIVLFIGIGGAALLLWIIFGAVTQGSPLKLQTVIPLLMVVLVAMLLTRQLIQNKKILPLERTVTANAREYNQALQPYVAETLKAYRADLPFSYDNAETIYLRSCAFCHGKNADGNGLEAKNLLIPPENLAALRTTRAYLNQIILQGVPGTGMGYFTIYDRYQVDDLAAYLGEKYHIFSKPGEIPAPISPQDLARAEATYGQTCATCHGRDGRGSPVSRGFQPPPPDLRVYSLVPHRSFQVITQGYLGTMMPGFAELPEEVRWGLGGGKLI
jgi:mono/diheme cytochrome c family protein